MKKSIGLILLLSFPFFAQAQEEKKQMTSAVNSELNFVNSIQPLFIVDGVKRPKSIDPSKSSISDISPDNIQKMEVLKRKDAILLYGNEAKDGVILITTKNNYFKKSDR